MTREEWLNKMTNMLREDFHGIEAPIPEKVRITCGWPSRSARPSKNQRIGECWSSQDSGDAHHEIFISPVLADPIAVAETLVHKLVHTTVGNKHGHKAPFRRVAVAMGLEGKMTATHAGEKLVERLHSLIKQVGAYPHAKISMSNQEKKQGTRMIKLLCPTCGYLARTTKKWIEMGTPTCMCGTKMEAT